MDDRFIQLSKNSLDIDNYTEDDEFDALEEMIMPKIRPEKKATDKPVIVVIDDDFSTLDLMKIYLQRSYEYVAFDGPRDAIFYLNRNVPDLIFMDCYMRMINTKRVIEIIRSYKELADVPIVYIAEPAEKGAVMAKAPEDVMDCITRPIARGDLQIVLDKIFQKT